MDFIVAALQVPHALGAAALGLGVFHVLFNVLTKVTGIVAQAPVVGKLAQYPLALVVDSLGPAAKFIPSSTHFFLAAVIAATVLPAVKLPALPKAVSSALGGARGSARTPSRRR